jgi:translocation protein SEC63
MQTPVLLSALLVTTTARSWLPPTLAIMRLHAYLAQALPPLTHLTPYHRLAQLPSIQADEIAELTGGSEGLELEEFARRLEDKKDSRAKEVRKAMKTWGRLELVDACFKGSLLLFRCWYC